MSKVKKIIIGLIILICISYWAVEKIITANISKTAIVKKLEDVTGYHVIITGELHWHYSLRPRLDIDKITFLSEKNESIILKNAHISLKLLPLLLKKLVSIDFSFQEWQQNKLHFTKGKAHIVFKNNVLNLTEFESQFYQGKIEGKADVDFNHADPQFNIILTAIHVEVADLLKDITQIASVSGKMNASTTLVSEGKNPQQFIQNLNGQLSVNVDNGKLRTIHFGNVIPNLPAEGADFFDHLKINAPIKNGIANTDISLLAKNYRADGTGTINFNNQYLNIKLEAYYTRSEKTKNIALPITISGAIASPNVSVNLTKPLNQLLKSDEIKIKDKINLLIKNL